MKLFHELVLRLRKTELEYDFTLHIVHVAGTRMIAQGTDGLSHGIYFEGVVRSEDMPSFVDLSRTAIERHPGVLKFVESWVAPVLGKRKVLTPDEWFREGHGIVGGEKDSTGLWIPLHASNGKVYIWTPPPIIADVALEECAKAIHQYQTSTTSMRDPHWIIDGCVPTKDIIPKHPYRVFLRYRLVKYRENTD